MFDQQCVARRVHAGGHVTDHFFPVAGVLRFWMDGPFSTISVNAGTCKGTPRFAGLLQLGHEVAQAVEVAWLRDLRRGDVKGDGTGEPLVDAGANHSD